MASTKSEQLFDSICESLGLVAEKVPVRNTKTPDFKVSGSGYIFYAEVKALEPSPADKARLIALRDCRVAETMVLKLGKRAARDIDAAAQQLKAVIGEGLPGVIVLFDNIRLEDGTRFCPGGPLESFHIHAAMFGEWVVDLGIYDGQIVRRTDRSGPGETVNVSRRAYVSAVAVLHDSSPDLSLVVYHNPYASRPLPVTVFTGPRCYNFGVSVENAKTPGSWVRLD